MARVDNAIILVAGTGSRMVPITYDIPKGLVKVRGEGLVERQIKQLLEKNIREIILITGYRHEDFLPLQEKYRGVLRCIYNPDFETKNNISSLYLARKYLKNTYILSCDNYYTENIFREEENGSWYCAVTDTKPRQEWGVTTNPEGRIVGIEKTAHAGQSFLYGAVYFNRQFSESFRNYLEKEYRSKETHDLFWEDILKKYIRQLEIKINPQSVETVYELESFEELRSFDESYLLDSRNPLLKKITTVFQVKETEISQIRPQKMGMTNDSFLFVIEGKRYIFRSPGKGSEKYIDRKKEKFIYSRLKEQKITDYVVYFDGKSGIKISVYEEGSDRINIKDKEKIKKAIQILKRVHQSGIEVEETFGLETCQKYEKEHKGRGEFFEGYFRNKEKIEQLSRYITDQGMKKVLCHTDFVAENILCLKNGDIRLIDWEYSAMADPMVDLAAFIICGRYGETELWELVRFYYERELTTLERMRVYLGVALSALTWSAWCKQKEYQGYRFQEEDYTENMYSYVEPYIKKAETWMRKCNEENGN